MKHSQGFLMLGVTQPFLCFWVNLVFVSSPSRIFISTPFGFFDVSPVEKPLSGLTPHSFLTPVTQAVPSTKQSPPLHQGTETGCFLHHASNFWIETCLSKCQNVLRLIAFSLSIATCILVHWWVLPLQW